MTESDYMNINNNSHILLHYNCRPLADLHIELCSVVAPPYEEKKKGHGDNGIVNSQRRPKFNL